MGGAVSLNIGEFTVSSTSFEGNSAEFAGGALDVSPNAKLSLEASHIRDNEAKLGGGSIFSEGTLTVKTTTIDGNRATDDGMGGGIYTAATATLRDSTVSRNEATYGGGIFTPEQVYLLNSTVAGNLASQAGGIAALPNDGSRPTVYLEFSTVAGNEAPAGGGGLAIVDGHLVVRASILANNDSGVAGTKDFIARDSNFDSRGYNLFYEFDSARVDPELMAPTDQVGTDPRLGPLGDNGGPTETMLPFPASFAVDGVPAEACTLMMAPLETDQRGEPRPSGAGCDIGAVER
jgi:predicted outer membrane repeat protein